jgi:hypothetical protein
VKFQIKDVTHKPGPLSDTDMFLLQALSGFTYSTTRADIFCGIQNLYAALVHASRHAKGGADALLAEVLGTAEMGTAKVLNPDGAGGVVWNNLGAPGAHAATHARTGGDPVTIDGLRTDETDVNKVLKPGPGNTVVWGADGGGGGYQPTRVIYVDPQFTSDVPGFQYSTIQAAIAYAQANVATKYEIDIAAGTYTGSDAVVGAGPFETLEIRFKGTGMERTVVNFKIDGSAASLGSLNIYAEDLTWQTMEIGNSQGAMNYYLTRAHVNSLHLKNTTGLGSVGLHAVDFRVDAATHSHSGIYLTRTTGTFTNDGEGSTLYVKECDSTQFAFGAYDSTIYIYPDSVGLGFDGASFVTFNYVPATSMLVGTKQVNEGAIADGKVPVYRTASGKLEYETPSGGSAYYPDHTLWVDAAATPVAGKIYNTISAAVAYAETQTGVWQINVTPGTYTEDVTSVGPTVIIIQGAWGSRGNLGTSYTETFAPRIVGSVVASNDSGNYATLLIRDLSIDATGKEVKADSQAKLNLQRCTIWGAPLNLDGSYPAGFLVADDCLVDSGPLHALYLNGSGASSRNLVVRNCTLRNTGTNPLIRGGADHTVWLQNNHYLTSNSYDVDDLTGTSPMINLLGPGENNLRFANTGSATINRFNSPVGTKTVDEDLGMPDGGPLVWDSGSGKYRVGGLFRPRYAATGVTRGSGSQISGDRHSTMVNALGGVDGTAISIPGGTTGNGYSVNEILTIAQPGSDLDATVKVTSEVMGAIDGLELISSGGNYLTGNNIPLTGGLGYGAEINVGSLIGGAVKMTSTPTVTPAPYEGLQIVLWNKGADTGTLTLQDESNLSGSKLKLQGGADAVLDPGDTLSLIWDEDSDLWREVSRSSNHA